jgi:nucleotide-binding universal stress UspA family protein
MKVTRKHILVAIDFHEQSLIALEETIELARFIKGHIVLLHVIDTGYFLSKIFSIEREAIEKIKVEATARLEEIAAKYASKGGVDITTRIEEGKIYQKILETAEDIKARFIIIGKNERKEGRRELLGSNTMHVISESKVPVISVAGATKIGYKNILLPLDLTKETREQLFNAIAFGLHYDATIHIVSVVMGGIQIKRSRIYAKMKKVQLTLQENEIKCTTQLFARSEKPAWEVVVNYAKKVNADLILVMTHQEGTTSDSYIGAFAHHMINESNTPVLSITSAAAKDEEGALRAIVDPLGILRETPKPRFKLFRKK